MSILGAQGVYPSSRNQPSVMFTLQPGATRLIPTGTWNLNCDGITVIQEFDPIQNTWGNYGGSSSEFRYINSDGQNYRVANLSGCVVGAVVTTAGSGYTTASPPTVTFSAGAAVAVAVIGGAVSTSVTVTNGGTNYTYPPLVFFDAPPLGSGGLQATAICTLSGSAVSTVTVINQGAGYTAAPNVYFFNDPRDTTGAGAQATATLTGAGTVTALNVTNWGTPQTSVPTITFSSGAAAATAIMQCSISAYTVTTAGSGYSGNVLIEVVGSGLSATSVLTNPKYAANQVRIRPALILASLSSGALTTSGLTVIDGGVFAGTSPTACILSGPYGTGAAAGAVGLTFANSNATVSLYPV